MCAAMQANVLTLVGELLHDEVDLTDDRVRVKVMRNRVGSRGSAKLVMSPKLRSRSRKLFVDIIGKEFLGYQAEK